MAAPITWAQPLVQETDPLDYTCGWRDRAVTARQGAYATESVSGNLYGYVRMCPGCGKPSWISPYEAQVPGPRYGEAVDDLADDLADLYREARDCVGIGAYHAAVM